MYWNYESESSGNRKLHIKSSDNRKLYMLITLVILWVNTRGDVGNGNEICWNETNKMDELDMYASTEAFLYAGIVGIGLEIAKEMIRRHGENNLRKKLQESGDLGK